MNKNILALNDSQLTTSLCVHMFWRSSLNINPNLNSLSYYVHMFPRQLTTRLSSCLNSHDREAVIPQSRCRGIGV